MFKKPTMTRSLLDARSFTVVPPRPLLDEGAFSGTHRCLSVQGVARCREVDGTVWFDLQWAACTISFSLAARDLYLSLREKNTYYLPSCLPALHVSISALDQTLVIKGLDLDLRLAVPSAVFSALRERAVHAVQARKLPLRVSFFPL